MASEVSFKYTPLDVHVCLLLSKGNLGASNSDSCFTHWTQVQTLLFLEQDVLHHCFYFKKASFYHCQRRQRPPNKRASLPSGIWKGSGNGDKRRALLTFLIWSFGSPSASAPGKTFLGFLKEDREIDIDRPKALWKAKFDQKLNSFHKALFRSNKSGKCGLNIFV